MYINPDTKKGNRNGWTCCSLFEEFTLVLIFGGLHVALYFFDFPTALERKLRLLPSAGTTTFPLAVLLIAVVFGYRENLARALWEKHTDGKGNRAVFKDFFRTIHSICTGSSDQVSFLSYFFQALMMSCTICLIAGYAFCAAYITVEPYYSMRRPPDGTFLVPRFIDYWPHL